MTTIDYGWGPPSEWSETEERAAIMQYDGGLSEAESAALAANSGKPDCGLTSNVVLVRTSHHDDHSDLIDHNLPYDKSVTTAILVAEHSGCECGNVRTQEPRHEPCAKGIFIPRVNNTAGSSLPSAHRPEIDTSPAPIGSGYCTTRTRDDVISREECVSSMLESEFGLEANVAELSAPDLTYACISRQLDPVAVLTDLGAKYRICKASGEVIATPAKWLFSQIRYYKPSDGFSDPRSVKKVDWAAIRKRIIDNACIGGRLDASDLRDWWEHNIVGSSRELDPQMAHAISAYERAGLVQRRGRALSILAERLTIERPKKQELQREQGMVALEAHVRRRWPVAGDRWEEAIALYCPVFPWRVLGGPGLAGLGEAIRDQGEPQRSAVDEQVRVFFSR